MVSVTMLTETIIAGILIGGLYAFMGLGLSLVLGVMNIINVVQGEMLVIGAYLGYWLFVLYGIDPLISMTVSMVALASVGWIIHNLLIRRLYGIPEFHINTLILTTGLLSVFQSAMLALWTADYRTIVIGYMRESFGLGWVTISIGRLLVFVIAILGIFAIYHFIMKTDLGMAVRATAQDREAAMLMGVNVMGINTLAFCLAAAIAGVAGPLFVSLYYAYPTLGSWVVSKMFIVTILAGLGSIPGLIVSGVVLGVCESLGMTLLAASYRDLFGFFFFLIVLLIKPSGLFGARS